MDFQLSYALYLYYTDAQQYKKYEEEGFPSKEEILLGMAASYEQDSDYKMESIIPETWLNLQD